MLGRHKENLVYPKTQGKEWWPLKETAQTSLDCSRVSCRGMGQQWPAMGTGALAPAVVGGTVSGISPLGRDHHSVQFSSITQSSPTLQSHEPQHTRPPCPSPTPGVHPNPCLLSQWCHSTLSSSVVPFSSCSQSFPASGSFQMTQLFASGDQSIGVSASTSVLPMNIQDWSLFGWTGWISLQSKGLSRVFFNTPVQKHQFFGDQLSSESNSHILTWPMDK